MHNFFSIGDFLRSVFDEVVTHDPEVTEVAFGLAVWFCRLDIIPLPWLCRTWIHLCFTLEWIKREETEVKSNMTKKLSEKFESTRDEVHNQKLHFT